MAGKDIRGQLATSWKKTRKKESDSLSITSEEKAVFSGKQMCLRIKPKKRTAKEIRKRGILKTATLRRERSAMLDPYSASY